MSSKPRYVRAGFTRIEILVIIAILVVACGLSLQTVQKMRFAAKLKETENRLKEVALRLHMCHDTYKRFPPAWGPFPPTPLGSNSPVVRGTLHYWLLPFIKGEAIFERGQPAATGGTPGNVWTNPDLYGQVVAAYLSPADYTADHGKVILDGPDPWGAGCIAANARVFGGLQKDATADAWDNKLRVASVADGTSNVIAFATRYARCGTPPGGSAWAGGNTIAGFGNFMKSGAFFASDIEYTPITGGYTRYPPFQVAPSVAECDPLLAHGYSRDGIQIALFDGSVRTVSPTIGSNTWGQACHPNDAHISGELCGGEARRLAERRKLLADHKKSR